MYNIIGVISAVTRSYEAHVRINTLRPLIIKLFCAFKLLRLHNIKFEGLCAMQPLRIRFLRHWVLYKRTSSQYVFCNFRNCLKQTTHLSHSNHSGFSDGNRGLRQTYHHQLFEMYSRSDGSQDFLSILIPYLNRITNKT
jgi:hypothetical protein